MGCHFAEDEVSDSDIDALQKLFGDAIEFVGAMLGCKVQSQFAAGFSVDVFHESVTCA